MIFVSSSATTQTIPPVTPPVVNDDVVVDKEIRIVVVFVLASDLHEPSVIHPLRLEAEAAFKSGSAVDPPDPNGEFSVAVVGNRVKATNAFGTPPFSRYNWLGA